MSAPRTARTGLSASSVDRSATAKYQVRPKSCDRPTITSRLLFCSHDAYTVCLSTGSTTICGSNCLVEDGTSGCAASHVTPLSLLTCRAIVGALHAGHSLTVPYCGNKI